MIIKNEENLANLDKDDFQFDIKKFLVIFIKNRNLIFKLSLFIFLISTLYCFFAKRIWIGEFQIVLEEKSLDFSTPSIPSAISSALIPEIDSLKDNTKTEVEILKSPSVLNNVFEFVKNKKINDGNSKYNPSFKVWRDNSLFIDLKKGTSVLTISFKDDDKEIILPVLSKISTAYQNYSGKRKDRKLELADGFLTSQISKYEAISKISRKKAQEFAFDNNLFFSNVVLNDFSGGNSKKDDFIDVEFLKTKISNDIKFIENKLELLYEINDINNEILYGSYINNNKLINSKTLERLQEINKDLISKSLIYKDKDTSIINLKKEKKLLLSNFKDEIINSLKFKKSELTASLRAIERPKEILIKYSDLLSKAKQDFIIFSKLQEKYTQLSFKKSQEEDPWQLITTPTLLLKPISPNVPLILFISIFVGLSIGFILAAIIEKRDNKVLMIEDTYLTGDWSYIIKLKPFGKKNWLDSLKVLLNQNLKSNTKKIVIHPIGEIKEKEKSEIINFLNNQKPSIQYEIIDDIDKLNNYSEIFVLTKLWEVKKIELSELNNNIKIQNNLSSINLIVLDQDSYKKTFLFKNFNKVINLIKNLN